MKEKTADTKRRKYDASFKEEVLKMALNDRPVGEVAQSPGIGENLIYQWKNVTANHLLLHQPVLLILLPVWTIIRLCVNVSENWKRNGIF